MNHNTKSTPGSLSATPATSVINFPLSPLNACLADTGPSSLFLTSAQTKSYRFIAVPTAIFSISFTA